MLQTYTFRCNAKAFLGPCYIAIVNDLEQVDATRTEEVLSYSHTSMTTRWYVYFILKWLILVIYTHIYEDCIMLYSFVL